MDWDVISGLGVVCVEGLVEGLHVIVKAGPGDTLDRHDADGVLVAELEGLDGVEGGLVERQGDGTHLNLPELGEFLPDNLETG